MRKVKYSSSDHCPCGSGKIFAQCCEPYLLGTPAPDAQALMRSRYTAYTLSDEIYLRKTWHPTTLPTVILNDKQVNKWLGLTIIEYQVEQESGQQSEQQSATVEFVAKYKLNGRAEKLHEKSRFVFEDGQWLYIDGIF